MLDDFSRDLSMSAIAETCQAVGFNTIPAWMRPYAVLSNGERFRVEVARRLLEAQQLVLIDEFTSVVDRQVAQIGSHAVQKYVRRHDLRLVAASCHYDVIEWLQPDWTFEPATSAFNRRRLRRRPEIDAYISRVSYDCWKLFAPYHYLTTELNKSARCFALFVDDRPVAFAGVLHRPHPTTRNVKGVSRLVTLPDWQGLGLAAILVEKLGAAYRALNLRLRTYPAHPSLIRTFGKSTAWRLVQKPMTAPAVGKSSSLRTSGWTQARRPNAVFEYCGAALDRESARNLIER